MSEGGMTGKEIYRLLEKACRTTGLPEAVTSRLLLNFTIAWGETLMTDFDNALFREMTAGHVPSQEAADMVRQMMNRDLSGAPE